MTFDNILDQAIEILQRRGRVTYRTLKRQFHLDDETLADLTFELIEGQRIATDEHGTVLVWIGEAAGLSASSTQPKQTTPQPEQHEQAAQVEPLPAEPHTPDAERRQLTILFTDLVDSTKLSGRLDAEDYREIVRAYQATCAEGIERFDCYLAQTLGDGLLIYSGYPVAHDNDAERAIRAGLGILDAMKTLNERLEREQGIRLAVRIGIHTGAVVIGEVGAGVRQEQLALGEVPNLAARIQGLAEPDSVVLSEATYRLIQGYFDCDALGEQILRGVAESVTVYRVLQESGFQSRLDVASARGLTPLAGREQETGLLTERWRQVKEGQGQVVLLSGEAGIGKSRLVQVLKDHVADESHIRLECRSSPYFTNSALYPIIDMVQRTLRFQADDTSEQKLEKLEHNLSQYRLPLDESVPLFAALLSLPVPDDRYPPLHVSPQRQREKTLEVILAIMMELSERQPVLFILEDLHWTDPTTLELLDLLIDQIPTASIYVLLTCRPTFQPSWSHRTYLTEMTVHRLSNVQAGQVVEKVTAGRSLPLAVLQQLIEKSDGVPLYLEEMTKAVLESGTLQAVHEHYELVGAFSSLAIPATLQDSLMARLDRLVTAKAVAQYAAVIGRQFSYELLQAVSHLDEAMLQHALRRLVEAELVYQRGLPPKATYTFKHALIQETAYKSLLKSTRQHCHERIAQVLEARFPETLAAQPELLAHHCTEAGLTEKAVGYWHQAGQSAIQRSAHVEAIAHLRHGLQLLQRLPETPDRVQQAVDMHIALGVSLIATKGYAAPEVGQTYTRAQQLCHHLTDPYRLFSVLRGLVHYYNVHPELQTAHALGEQLLAVAQQTQDVTMLLGAYQSLGTTSVLMGAIAAAHTHLTHGIALYEPQAHHASAFIYGQDAGVVCYSYAGWTLWYLGYPAQGLKRTDAALTLAQQAVHPFSWAYALSNAAVFHQLRREVRCTQERAEAALRLAQEQQFALWLAHGAILRGWALVHQGQTQEGIAQINQGMMGWRATGAEIRRPYFLALLAEVHGIM
jgi:class 3 adenylate cyclase/tetratricopeptide (TPR) repeat protein